MIGQKKSLASLSSTLLARKGTARPAMRPQGFGGFGAMPGAGPGGLEDLGWNDMGDPEPEAIEAPAPPVLVQPVPVPPVLLQREALHEEYAEPAVETPVKTPRSVSVATATRIGRETHAKHVGQAKSAFTLRLDTDRHLKLRLASALQNRSAQQLVTEALDAFLANAPGVDMLISQLPARSKR